jgi:hypothetical protein
LRAATTCGASMSTCFRRTRRSSGRSSSICTLTLPTFSSRGRRVDDSIRSRRRRPRP